MAINAIAINIIAIISFIAIIYNFIKIAIYSPIILAFAI
jgi:hypothetical protein